MILKKNGFTTVELMISFVIVAAIVITMLMTVLSIREAQYSESVYGTVMSAKNSITKHIQDDLTKRKINTVSYDTNTNTLYFRTDDKNRSITIEKQCITYLNERSCLPILNEDDTLLVYDLENIYYEWDNGYLILKVPIIHPDLEEKVTVEIIAPLS